jgi:hypothetical protein
MLPELRGIGIGRNVQLVGGTRFVDDGEVRVVAAQAAFGDRRRRALGPRLPTISIGGIAGLLRRRPS